MILYMLPLYIFTAPFKHDYYHPITPKCFYGLSKQVRLVHMWTDRVVAKKPEKFQRNTFPTFFQIAAAILGNILVCVAIATDRNLRKLSHLFFVSMAIAGQFALFTRAIYDRNLLRIAILLSVQYLGLPLLL